MGDMFDRAPGIIDNIAVTVEEQSTWELDDDLQFPHFIKAACQFKYIGDYIPASTGKHYGISWLEDGKDKLAPFASDVLSPPRYPNRKTREYRDFFGKLPDAQKSIGDDQR